MSGVVCSAEWQGMELPGVAAGVVGPGPVHRAARKVEPMDIRGEGAVDPGSGRVLLLAVLKEPDHDPWACG